MTFEELNIVRSLKKKIANETRRLKALEIIVGSLPHKYGKSEGGSSGKVAKSDFESLIVQIADTEIKIENLQKQITVELPLLTKKIQENFSDSTEQTLLIYRYVACEVFRNISYLMGYSVQWVYWKHNQLLKSLELIRVN